MGRHRRTEVEIVVIGGGPAGAAAACLLATWGHSVALLTRPASRQALAESLPPSCAKLFERLGVTEAIEAGGFIRATGNTVWWGMQARVEQFARGATGYQILRSDFDRVLLERAAEAGVAVRRTALVRDVRRDSAVGAPFTVHWESRATAGELRASWVLDCTGRSGLLARRAGRVSGASGSRTVALVGVWERVGGWHDMLEQESHTLVESYERGWGWSVPVSHERRFFTVMVDPALTTLAGRRRLTSVYHAELARLPQLGRLAPRGRLVGRSWARDASPYIAREVCAPGLLLVGDAASFVDPLSSFGVKKALASAWLAAVATHTALSKPALARASLELFATRERAMYESLQRRLGELSRDAADAHATRFWTDRADVPWSSGEDELDVALLRDDPDVLAAFAELKRRPSIALRPAAALRAMEKPTVRGNEVVLEPHLASPALTQGVRYVRSVDLVALAELAPAHEHVPALFDAYNRAVAPAPLPDFLGALSLLVGKGMLSFA